MVVADSETALQVTGNGDVLEPNDGIIGMGVHVSLCIYVCWYKHVEACGSTWAHIHEHV